LLTESHAFIKQQNRMDNTEHRRLQELDRSDFEIVKGEPDIRGWDVRNSAGQKLGEVEELIVDAQKKKVRYMVVDLDDNEVKVQHRKVLIPIGLAELHKEDDDVLLPAVTADHLNALPAYEKDNLTEEIERRICDTLGRKAEPVASPATGTDAVKKKRNAIIIEHDDDFYRHEQFQDNNLYKHRRREADEQQQKNHESEYEKGLRLWELRSQGGVIPGEGQGQREREREVNEERRMEVVRARRKEYEERRRPADSGDHHRRKGKTIIDRIKDEGLREEPYKAE